MLTVEIILHPTDFSEHSDNAFRLAASLARDYGARLVVVHVGRSPVVMPLTGVVPPDPEAYRKELAANLRQYQARAAGVTVESRLVLNGDPAGGILQVAQECQCDLIVMGTHGRTGLGHLLMGSVAEQVVRKAPCPVLTIKTPFIEVMPAEAGSGIKPGQAKEVAKV
jgi:nucleotide-binding universal stress UspA family protein